ncbi:MAG: glycosyltransferase 87 family protein [Naasia sp.]
MGDGRAETTIEHSATPFPSARRVWAQRLLLLGGFVVVHLTLALINLYDTLHFPFGDVTGVYRFWMDYARDNGVLVGIDTSWVYPIGALAPIALPYLAGSEFYGQAWLVMIAALNAVAVIALARRRLVLAWWWLLFLACLGPVAVGRIDAVSAPLAIVAVLIIARHPLAAGVLLTVAAWIKVWPAAVVAAAVIALRSRVRVVLGAAAATVATVGAALALGAGAGVLSFVFEQTGRGLQVEAPVSIWWLASAALGTTGAQVYYDTDILTYQVSGPGTQIVADLMTPVLAVVVASIVAAAGIAVRRGAERLPLFADVSLALVLAFIVVNKVGSPQFIGWLAAPVLLLLLLRGRREAGLAVTVLLVALATQAIYPWYYSALIGAEGWMVILIAARHVVLLALLAIAVARVLAARATVETPRARDAPAGRVPAETVPAPIRPATEGA